MLAHSLAHSFSLKAFCVVARLPSAIFSEKVINFEHTATSKPTYRANEVDARRILVMITSRLISCSSASASSYNMQKNIAIRTNSDPSDSK